MKRWIWLLVAVPLMAQDPGCAEEESGTPAALADSNWASIADSDMRTGGPTLAAIGSQSPCESAGGYWDTDHCQLYDPNIDLARGTNPFVTVQNAWVGSACDETNDEVILFGGGHGDSSNNGVFAVGVTTGDWRRVTQPTQGLWQNDTPGETETYCPSNVCTPPFGETCVYIPGTGSDCNVLPDGSASSRHSYDLLQVHDGYLYVFGGAIAESGFTGNGPPVWRLGLSSGIWEDLTDFPGGAHNFGGTAINGGEIYYAFSSFKAGVYTIATDSWVSGFTSEALAIATQLVYVPDPVDEIFALGGNVAWSLAPSSWPTGTPTIYTPEGTVATNNAGGTVYYPPEKLILIWHGGQEIETFDPLTGTFSSVTLGGENPGNALSTGVWSKFQYCGERLVLIDGVDKKLYYVDTSGGA